MINPVVTELRRMNDHERDRRETALAAETREALGYEPPALPANAAERLEPFNRFCAERGVSHLPARCETVAAFLFSIVAVAPSIDRVLDILSAIEAAHDALLLSSPVRSPIVAAAMAHWPQREPPRSWPKADKLAFLQLPLMVQHVIARRERERDATVRRFQNTAAQQWSQARREVLPQQMDS